MREKLARYLRSISSFRYKRKKFSPYPVIQSFPSQEHTPHDSLLAEVKAYKEAFENHSIYAVCDKSGKCIEVNDNFSFLSGFSKNELLTQFHPGFTAPGTPMSGFANGWKQLLDGRPWRGELCSQKKDGTSYWVEATIVPLKNEDGTVEKCVSIMFDITERKNAQQQGMEREKTLTAARISAEDTSKAKSKFLAHMSHEIRTPMNGIIGMTELLLDTALTEIQKDFALTVKESAEYLLTVINDILDFSKIEAGKLQLLHIDFEVEPLFTRLQKIFLSKIKEKNLHYSLIVDPKVPRWLKGDPDRLTQVMLNLIANAVKFTPPNGSIHITIKVSAETQDAMTLAVSIADTGIGIAASALEEIFNPFRQADASISRKYGGTGLGLGISSRIVKMMGGVLQVKSQIGKGSEFSFTINLSKTSLSETAVSPADKIAKSFGKSLKILLAEDNIVNQKLVVRILEAAGHKVFVAQDGDEAVELFAKQTFDLILMDIQMPNMSGEEAVSLIRTSSAGADVPIIALTAHAMAGDREKYLAMGMDGYISKPINRAEFFELIKELCP